MRTRALAYIRPDGSIVVDSRFKTESDVWQICAGWPDDDEVEDLKQEGFRVVECDVLVD